MIREATIDDVDQIKEALEDTDYSGFPGPPVKPKDFIASVIHDIDRPLGLVVVGLIDDLVRGVVVTHLFPYYFNLDVIQASVRAWNVTDDCRGCTLPVKMLRYTMKRCKGMGASMIDIAHVPGHTPASVKKVYSKLGFNELETIYRMEV